jgi:cytochrome d ubiquinol oxidase subunit II
LDAVAELLQPFAPGVTGEAFWLPLIWAGLLAVAVAMYVVMDGFDLGVGILFNAAGSENWRDRMMLSVAPIWDGNETWLILGGGGLLAVFYLAYAILLPALYIPLLIMLIALIFRGVAFEFRFKADTSKRVWDYSFHYGSLVATFAQGLVLGAFVQGFRVEGRGFAGGTFDWLTPFSLTTGLGLVAGYGLLGATWCVMKTTGELELWARRKAIQFLVATIVLMGIVSLWVPFLGLRIEQRWFTWPNIAFLAPVPLLTAYTAWRIYRNLEDNNTYWPFFQSILLFLLGFLGLAISLFPYIIPPSYTIWQAASTPSSQKFALVGYSVVMPLTFIYTAYAYYVFRGKVAETVQQSGYH